jgi:hypothetical protein
MLGAGINTAVVVLEGKEMLGVRVKGIVCPVANIN